MSEVVEPKSDTFKKIYCSRLEKIQKNPTSTNLYSLHSDFPKRTNWYAAYKNLESRLKK